MKKQKWFSSCKTAEELKQLYKKLAIQFHPDLHPENPDALHNMQEINNEYDIAFEILKDIHVNSKGEMYTATTPTTEAPEEFRQIVLALLKFTDIVIELCGSWLWVTGNTKDHKEEIKALGFKWSAKKTAWYFHHGAYKKRSKKSLTLDEIRGFYGSERVTTTKREELA